MAKLMRALPVFKTDDDKNWLKTVLREQDVIIEFIKKDGSVRKMTCTLSENKIPQEKQPKNSGFQRSDDVCAVFDLEKNEWRSFRYDSIEKIYFEA